MEFLKPKTSCKTLCFFLNVVMFLKKHWRRCFWRCSSKHANDVNVRAKVVRSFSSTSNPLYIFSSTLITSSTTPSTNFWPSYRHCTPPLPASKIASYNNFHKNFSHDQIRLHDVLCFNEHRQKTLTSISFQQHRQNIASIAKSMMF